MQQVDTKTKGRGIGEDRISTDFSVEYEQAASPAPKYGPPLNHITLIWIFSSSVQ
jgi:hypothetical protein